MKRKILTTVIAVAMAIGLVACGSSSKTESLTTDGITIEGDYGEATKVTTKTKSLSDYADLSAYLADKTTGSVVYDITIKDKNGKAVQPKGSVNVTVDTEGIAGKNSDYVVYFVDKNGAFEKVPVVSSTAKTVTFKTTHFSVYAVCVYDKEKFSDENFLKTSKDVEAEAAKAAENTESATESNEADASASTEGAYTYADMSATMFAQQTVNVRDLPDTSGNKIGSLKTNDEIVVTGQCNETGWYRISYGGGTAYVSNSYVASEKVAVSQPKNDAAGSSAGNNGGGNGESSTNNNIQYGSDGVATSGVPDGVTTQDAVAKANAMGYDIGVVHQAEDGHYYCYYIESGWPTEPGTSLDFSYGSGSLSDIAVLSDYMTLRRCDFY